MNASLALVVCAAFACGPSGASDPTTGDGSGGPSSSSSSTTIGDASESSSAADAGPGATTFHTTTSDASTTGPAGTGTGDACAPLLDETDSLGEVELHVMNTSGAPVWVALHESGCYNQPLVITAPDGHVVDTTQPVVSTCETFGGGAPGVTCEDYWLVLLDADYTGDAVWTGFDFETHVIPEGCAEAGESCERARVAEAGTYEVSAWISASTMCGEGPCVCDGGSDPCLIDDPRAVLVDPQVVSATFDFPTQQAVELELTLQ